MDEYLTVAEIAEKLKLTQQTVRNWIFSTGFGDFSGPD
jgi:predicted transcriptional regulator